MLVLATTQPVLAQQADPEPGEGLFGESTTTVVVVPDEGAILVRNAYRFTNGTVDETFTGFFETVPWDATDVLATSSGEKLTLVATPGARRLFGVVGPLSEAAHACRRARGGTHLAPRRLDV